MNRDKLEEITLPVEMGFLRHKQICPENIAEYDKYGDLSQYLFAGEIKADPVILNGIYFNSSKFFELSGISKPSFYNENYFQDLFGYYEYQVHYSEIGSAVIKKIAKHWTTGYKFSPARFIYGQGQASIKRKKPILSKCSFLAGHCASLDYAYMLRDYFGEDIDSLSGLTSSVTGFNLMSAVSINFVGGRYKQVLLLPLIVIPLIYIFPLLLVLAFLIPASIFAITIYCLLNIRFEKLDQHFDLAFKHEELIEQGLERILNGRFL